MEKAPPNRLMLGMGMAALVLFFGAAVYWLYLREAQYLTGLIQADRALIVYREYLSIAYFAPVAAISISAVILIQVLHQEVLKRPLSRFIQHLQTVLLGGMILGLGLMVGGGYFVDATWEPRFEASGYSRCENAVVRFDKSFTHTAWMKRAEDCMDEEAHKILHDHHGRRGFALVSRMLERKHWNQTRR